RAADVVESDVAEEVNTLRVAPVLAADAELDALLPHPCLLDGHTNQCPHSRHVDRLEGTAVEDLRLDVTAQELGLDVVARHAKRSLGEVVRAEAEEVRVLGYVIRKQTRSRQLDHRPDCELDRVGAFFEGRSLGLPNHELA